MISDISFVDPDPPFWTTTSWLQLGYGVWANLTMLSLGLGLGFSAVLIPQLHEADSLIVVTERDETIITSVLTISAPIGCLVCGIVMDRCGRRVGMILCHIPIILGWFYMAFAAKATDFVVGRVIMGVGMGMVMLGPRTYVAEITLPNMRGVVGALPNLFTSVGLTLQACLGAIFHWTFMCYLCGGYSVIIMCCNMFLPDTPYFIMLKASASKANHVLSRFRSRHFNIKAEVKELATFKCENNIRRLTFRETIQLLFRPSTCKPFGIILFYGVLTQMVGVNVVLMWATELLERSKSSVDASVGNIFLGLTRTVVGVITSWLLFKLARRALALTSALGLGLVCIGLGTFLISCNSVTVVPQLFFIAYIAFATLGYYNLPILMMSELLPLQVRGLMSGIVVSFMNISIFIMNELFPPMRDNLGLGQTFIVYGLTSFLGALVLYFILPETKDLTLQEIEEYFNYRRSTLVSQRQMRSSLMLASTLNLNKPQRRRSDKDEISVKRYETNEVDKFHGMDEVFEEDMEADVSKKENENKEDEENKRGDKNKKGDENKKDDEDKKGDENIKDDKNKKEGDTEDDENKEDVENKKDDKNIDEVKNKKDAENKNDDENKKGDEHMKEDENKNEDDLDSDEEDENNKDNGNIKEDENKTDDENMEEEDNKKDDKSKKGNENMNEDENQKEDDNMEDDENKKDDTNMEEVKNKKNDANKIEDKNKEDQNKKGDENNEQDDNK